MRESRQFFICRCLRKYFALLLITSMGLWGSFPAIANDFVISVKDHKHKLLVNVVTFLEPLDQRLHLSEKASKKGFIRQRNKSYIPHVSIFQKGTAVTFVNQDRFKHHVYSFSKPKQFEIKLYSGKPPQSIIFNKVGAVTMGCNIHDHMLAYAYVVDTPFYALSAGNGLARLKNIPNGKYRLKIWHPHLKSGKPFEKIVNFPMKNNNLSVSLVLKPMWKSFRKKRSNSFSDDKDYLF